MSSRDALAQAHENVAYVKESAVRLRASIEAAQASLAETHELLALLDTPTSEG
jgi:hypothetical protein